MHSIIVNNSKVCLVTTQYLLHWEQMPSRTATICGTSRYLRVLLKVSRKLTDGRNSIKIIGLVRISSTRWRSKRYGST